MWWTRVRVLRGGIEHLGFFEYFVSEGRTEEAGRIQIYGSAEDVGEFPLNPEKRQTWCEPRLELYEHVNVTLRREIFAEN